MKSANFLILFILLFNRGLGQRSMDKSGEFLKLSIVSYTQQIDGYRDSKFVLGIMNISDTLLEISDQYVFGPAGSVGCDITYEIYYCTKKDTTDVLAGTVTMVQRDFLYANKFSLHKNNSCFITTDSPFNTIYRFKKKGGYKIRFTLKSSCMKEYLKKDISTDWALVNLK